MVSQRLSKRYYCAMHVLCYDSRWNIVGERPEISNHPGCPMLGSILYASPPGCYQWQGKYSSQGKCDDVMVFLPIFLHIDGVHITTKRNCLSECVSIYFLIMRSDVVEPCLLTSKPSEHTTAILRGMQREFAVRDFLTVINKLHRIWPAMVKDNTKPRK